MYKTLTCCDQSHRLNMHQVTLRNELVKKRVLVLQNQELCACECIFVYTEMTELFLASDFDFPETSLQKFL